MTITDHPLGFRKTYLLRTRWLSIRIHRWHTLNEDPHNHRWPFLAIPLRGRFADTRWATAATGGDWTRYLCAPTRAAGSRPPLVAAGGSRLTWIGMEIRRPLRPYRCRLGEIHSYQPIGDGPHLSLMFIGRVRRSHSDVWRRGGRA